MASYINDITYVQLNPNTYRNCNMQTIDLRNVPWNSNSMYAAFENCSNLTRVVNVSTDVTNITKSFANCPNLTQVVNLPSTIESTPGVLSGLDYTFYGCERLVDVPTLPTSCTAITATMNSTFANCYNLVNITSIPNYVNSLFNTFSDCRNLVNAPYIPNSVNTMTSTFHNCFNLVNAPAIPNSVTALVNTFDSCRNMTSIPVIPDSVVNMTGTFQSCSKLSTIPNIPSSVTILNNTFANCTNLTGNVYINSSEILDANTAFGNTSLVKNVYIPYYTLYTNKVNTTTKTTFATANYDEIGTTDNVYLKTLTPVLTINATPSTALIQLEANGHYLTDTAIAVPFNSTVNWTVQAANYITRTGTQIMTTTDLTLDIELDPAAFRLTVTPVPSDATVRLEAAGYTPVEGMGTQYIEVELGTEVTYTVSMEGFEPKNDTITITEDTEITVELEELPEDWEFTADSEGNATLLEYTGIFEEVTVPDTVTEVLVYTITINPTPADANVVLVSDDPEHNTQIGNSITTAAGANVTYTVSKEGYISKSNTVVVNANMIIDVTLDSVNADAGEVIEQVTEINDAGSTADPEIVSISDAGSVED